jgi:drug/metabolite transporter (DMT)-like permease
MNTLLYSLTAGIWGSTWLAITFQFGVVPIDVSVTYRFGLASLLIFVWCLVKRLNLKFSFRAHLFFIAQGFFLFSMNYVAIYEAAWYVPSGLNAVGFSSVLVFNIINSSIFYRTPITLPVVVGTVCGLGGIFTIFWPAIVTLNLTNGHFLGILFSLGAGLLASFGNMIAARNQKENIPVMESNAYGMGYGTLWMLGVLLIKGTPLTFDFSPTYVLSLFYLSVFGTIIAFGCYLTLLGRIGANRAAYSIVLAPVIALILSMVFENFNCDLRTFLGIGLILSGNVIILGRRFMKVSQVSKLSSVPTPSN